MAQRALDGLLRGSGARGEDEVELSGAMDEHGARVRSRGVVLNSNVEGEASSSKDN
jgi:hypothetical protein